MSGLNKVTIIGNVGRDPESRFTPGGAQVTSFSVAVGRRYKDAAGNTQNETEWFNVVAWNKLAEVCNEYVTKGRKVYIEGRLQTRSWEGTDGAKKYKTEVIATEIACLLDKRSHDDSDDNQAGDTDEAPTF